MNGLGLHKNDMLDIISFILLSVCVCVCVREWLNLNTKMLNKLIIDFEMLNCNKLVACVRIVVCFCFCFSLK